MLLYLYFYSIIVKIAAPQHEHKSLSFEKKLLGGL